LTAKKDIILNQDMFILNSLGEREEPSIGDMNQVQVMVESAILKLREENQWIPNKINIDD